MVPGASPRSVAAPASQSSASPQAVDAADAVAAAAATSARPVIHQLPRPSRIRSPSEVVRLIGALVFVLLGYIGAIALRDGVATFQGGMLETVASFPAGVRATLVGVTQLVALVAPAAVVIVLLLRRRFRVLLTVAVAVVVAAAVMWLARS